MQAISSKVQMQTNTTTDLSLSLDLSLFHYKVTLLDQEVLQDLPF